MLFKICLILWLCYFLTFLSSEQGLEQNNPGLIEPWVGLHDVMAAEKVTNKFERKRWFQWKSYIVQVWPLDVPK